MSTDTPTDALSRQQATDPGVVSARSPVSSPLNPNIRNLVIKVQNGSSFADALVDQQRSSLTLGISFLSQRYQTPATAYTENPEFASTFVCPLPDVSKIHVDQEIDFARNPPPFSSLFPNKYHQHIHTRAASSPPPLSSYLSLSEPLQVSLFRTAAGSTTPSLLAAALCEWRFVFVHGLVDVQVQLRSTHISDLILGVVHLQLAVVPLTESDALSSPSPIPLYVSAQLVGRHVNNDIAVAQSLLQRLYRQWLQWDLALAHARPTRTHLHTRRGLPLFVRDEFGTRRPVTAFVYPLACPGDSVATPALAAEMVSGVAYSSGQSETWLSMSSMLYVKQASAAEHAVLLCSLLLGFGLDAYVAYGTAATPLMLEDAPAALPTVQPYFWVVTIDKRGQHARKGRATHWDAVTGRQYRDGTDTRFPFQRLFTLFRHDTFAHCLWDVELDHLSYVLPPPCADLAAVGPERAAEEGDGWVTFPTDALARVARPAPYKLAESSINPAAAEQQLEDRLRTLIATLRKRKLGDTTATYFSSQLSYLLKPCLYELAVLGARAASDIFEEAVFNSTAPDSLFLALPVRCESLDAREVMQTLLGAPTASQILAVQHTQARFAVKARVIPLPEGLVTTWVAMAVTWPQGADANDEAEAA